jgi:pimeloyl-ACP methyl ester carboxylesterase
MFARPIALLTSLWLMTLVLPGAVVAQTPGPLVGPWSGEIRVAGITLQMRVVFTGAGDELTAAIDIPQQGATGIPLRNVTSTGNKVRFELPAGPGVAVFDGERAGDRGDRIEGAFTQAGQGGTFVLARGNTPPPQPASSATDLPYDALDVTFAHDGVTLAGTVTTPRGAGPFPAVVLVSGSGSQTRDADVVGFKIFGTLADALTRAGIAVLRYDDRGVGQSSGPADVTTEAYTADVLAAVAMLKARPSIRVDRIGVMGHSEGALVAASAAGASPDVAFVILMAGPAVTGELIVRAQAEAMVRAAGGGDAQATALRAQQDRLFAAVRTGDGWDAIEASTRAQGRAQIAALPEAQRQALGDPEAYLDGVINTQLAGAKSGWYRYFIDYDPAPALRAVERPVLALFGAKDLQVLLEQNRPVLESLFAGPRAARLTVRVFAEANHLFQPARTGAPVEYPGLPKAFVPGFTEAVAEWILNLAR